MLLRLISIVTFIVLINSRFIIAQSIYVSPNGSTDNEGTINSPISSFSAAVEKVRKLILKKNDINVFFRGGTYFFNETVDLRDNLAPLVIGYFITSNEYPNYIQHPRRFTTNLGIRGNVNRRLKRFKNATILPKDSDSKAAELKAETV